MAVVQTQCKGNPDVVPYVIKAEVSGTLTAGTPVVIDGTAKTILAAADQATTILGWLMEDGVAGDTVQVLCANDDTDVAMTGIGTWAATLVGDYVGLDLTSTVFAVNLDDTSNKLFLVRGIASTSPKVIWVNVPSAKSQRHTEN
jgi:hypothetical protein